MVLELIQKLLTLKAPDVIQNPDDYRWYVGKCHSFDTQQEAKRFAAAKLKKRILFAVIDTLNLEHYSYDGRTFKIDL